MSTNSLDYTALVAGSGSIGRRHMRNLRTLGIQHLVACDTDAERLSPVISELNVKPFTDYERALAETSPDIVFVCTPPVFHVSQARQAVQAGAHVFIEKPLSNTLDGVDELIAEAEARRRIVQVGYNLRFHPGLQMVKRLLAENAIGRVLWACAEVGQYLPDWRPWQDYRQSYTARQDLGGGIILDASHELDYIIWLLGQPVAVMCMASKVSSLEVDVEDCADVLLRFSDGTQADVHLDFVQREYTRSCKLVGESGTLLWNYAESQLRLYQAENSEWETIPYIFDANQMYMAEVEHFLTCVIEDVVPVVGLRQARCVLEVALAARVAACEERGIELVG